MSFLFGTSTAICDGCALELSGGRSVALKLCLFEGRDAASKFVADMQRHYCAECSLVALDQFREHFARLPVVLNLATAEPGDVVPVIPEPPPPDPRAIDRGMWWRYRFPCQVCSTSIGRHGFTVASHPGSGSGTIVCSPKCADELEAKRGIPNPLPAPARSA